MKRILTIAACSITCSFSALSQRAVDLSLTIDSPESGAYIPPMQTFSIDVTITNTGSIAFNASDTVAYYMLINGDTLTFQPQNENHFDYTGFSLQPGATHTITRSMAFDDSFEGQIPDFCVFVNPVNASDPIADPELNNNSDCIQIFIMEDPSLGTNEHETAAISIYPNPAAQQITIESSEAVTAVSFVNVSGEIVKTTAYSGGLLDCSDLDSGVYFLHLATKKGVAVRRLIIGN